MRSLGWDLIQYDVLAKRRNLDPETDIYKGNMVWQHPERRQPCVWNHASPSQGMPRLTSKHQKLEEAGKDSPLQLSESMSLPTSWFQTSSFQNYETTNVCFKPPSFGYFVTTIPGNLIQLSTQHPFLSNNTQIFICVFTPCAHEPRTAEEVVFFQYQVGP